MKKKGLINYISSIGINSTFLAKAFQIGFVIGISIGIVYYINR